MSGRSRGSKNVNPKVPLLRGPQSSPLLTSPLPSFPRLTCLAEEANVFGCSLVSKKSDEELQHILDELSTLRKFQ